MIIFKNQGGLDFIENDIPSAALFSFGNMGQATIQSSKSLIDWDDLGILNMMIQCEKTTQIS